MEVREGCEKLHALRRRNHVELPKWGVMAVILCAVVLIGSTSESECALLGVQLRKARPASWFWNYTCFEPVGAGLVRRENIAVLL